MARKYDQIRLKNLEMLISEAGNASELARVVGTSSSYLSQIRNQMCTRKGTPRTIGDKLAEKLEKGMNKPQGWMDELQISNNHINESYSQTLCPLISWKQASQHSEILSQLTQSTSTELFPCPINCSDCSFALQVQGASMEPKFESGDLIFVDPEIEAEHGNYIVVQSAESDEAIFRRLIIEGGRSYLQALNPEWPDRFIEIDHETTIIGVIVFKGATV